MGPVGRNGTILSPADQFTADVCPSIGQLRNHREQQPTPLSVARGCRVPGSHSTSSVFARTSAEGQEGHPSIPPRSLQSSLGDNA